MKVGDTKYIGGHDVEVVEITSCDFCCFHNTMICAHLDPNTPCGNRTGLGFRYI